MVAKKWNDEKIGLMEKYWYSKTTLEIAEILGMSRVTVSKKASKIGLEDKRKMSRGADGIYRKPKYIPKLKEVKEYGPRYATIKENKGRKTTEKIKQIKENFKKGDLLEFIDYESANSQYRSLKEHLVPVKKHGTVVDVTDCQIVVKGENYNECFKFVDMLSGKTIVEGLNVCS